MLWLMSENKIPTFWKLKTFDLVLKIGAMIFFFAHEINDKWIKYVVDFIRLILSEITSAQNWQIYSINQVNTDKSTPDHYFVESAAGEQMWESQLFHFSFQSFSFIFLRSKNYGWAEFPFPPLKNSPFLKWGGEEEGVFTWSSKKQKSFFENLR